MRKTRAKPQNDALQDIYAVSLFLAAAVLLLGIIWPESGWLGRTFGGILRDIAGIGAFAVPLTLGLLGWVLLTRAHNSASRNQIVGAVLFFVTVVIFCQLVHTASLRDTWDSYINVRVEPREFDDQVLKGGGGWVGFSFAFLLEAVVGRACSFIVLTAMAFVSLLLLTGIPATELVNGIIDVFRPIFLRKRKAKVTETRKVRPGIDDPKEKNNRTIIDAIREKLPAKDEEPQKTAPIKSQVRIIHGDGGGNVAKSSQPVVRPQPKGDGDYHLPPVTLLNEPSPAPKRAQAELNYKIDKIEQTLDEFKIEADVVEVSHGPTVTRYEIQLAPGIKVSKIVSLADNLAMALAAIDVRVEAPIPGKSAIGVEVPNDNPALVGLREVIDSDQFWNASSKLTFALGKDVAGEPKYADLTKMPHLLIAGATNAGKSVCLNTLIASLLFRASPRDVKFILIDPKRVELSLFDGIPHLCSPVIKDVRQAAGILRTVLKEMDKRYDLFVNTRTKNFESYNSKVKPEERIPYIVVVVDELADLMMQAGPEVEFCIFRLAQLARATGIHLVIATQRPSVDVITGTIKANISSRIAFSVTSMVDSRTILDMGGAERLIGRGDMLFKPIDVGKPLRVQGCFVTEKEIDDLVQYLKDQEAPDYTMTPSFVGDGPSGGPGGGGNSDGANDELYEPAVRLVVSTGYASTSMIQRRFKIGYTRAARLVDTMQEHGLVGPPDGSKPREIIISKGDLDRVFGQALFSNTEEPEDATEKYEEEEE